MRNPIWEWQELSPSSKGGKFFKFCDALEVKDGVSAPASGWGLEHALQAWGKYMPGYLAESECVSFLFLLLWALGSHNLTHAFAFAHSSFSILVCPDTDLE